MTVQQQVLQLPKTEKLKLMEMLWADLSESEADFESPAWHEKALRETEQRLELGEEQTHDWEVAKRKLREQ
ncbi:MAG: hypothetical protein ACI8QI_000595 [Limisphaerales bacterium]|jgi:hypothetical protein